MNRRYRLPLRSPLKTLFLLAAGWFGAAAGNAEEARAYPPEIAAWDEATKAAQRQAGQKFLADLASAIQSGAKSLIVPKGDYRFEKAPGGCHVSIKGAQDLTIDGQGSTFWCEEQASAVVFSGCRNVSLKNLFIDWDPLPYVQGEVIGIDPAGQTVDLRLDQTFARTTEAFARLRSGDPGKIRGAFFDRATRQLKPGQVGFMAQPFWENRVAERTYRVKLRIFGQFKLADLAIAPGDLLALWLRSGRTFIAESCGPMTFENVTLYASGFVCFHDAVGEGPVVYRRCRVVRRPDTDRLMGGNADGFNSSNMEHGPMLEDCEIDTIGDDAVNVHGHYYRVLWQESPTTIITDWIGYRPEYKANLTLNFYRHADFGFLETRVGIKTERTKWTLTQDKCLFDQATDWHSGGNGGLTFGETRNACRVVLDRPYSMPRGTIFSCEDYVGQGAVIRGCRFKNLLANGFRLQTYNVTVENNWVERTTASGIAVTSYPTFWGEATNAHHVRIAGNTLVDIGIDKLAADRFSPALHVESPGDYRTTLLQHDLEICDNRIIRPGSRGIMIKGVKGLRLSGNLVALAPDTPREAAADPLRNNGLWVEEAQDAVIENNRVCRENEIPPAK